MKKLIICFIVLLSQLSFSQVDSLAYYHQKGDYNKAINFGEKQKKTFKIKDTDYALLVNNLATAYSHINDYKNAELNYLENLELVKSFFGENDKIVAMTYQNLGNVSLNNEKAKNYFLKAIDILSKNNETKSQLYGNLLSSLALTYRNLGENQKAKTSYLLAIEILLEINGEKDISYHGALLSYAIFLDKTNEIKKAEELYVKSYTLQKENLRSENISTYVITLGILGNLYSKLRDFNLEEKIRLESLEITEKYKNHFNSDYIQSLESLAFLYSYMNENKKALFYLEKANKLLIETNLEYSDKNAFYLHSLGKRYSAMGKYDVSENYLKKEIEVYEFLKNRNSLHIAYLSLADNYSNKGDYKNAEIIYSELLQKQDLTHDTYFKALEATIHLYMNLENKNKAKNLISKFIEAYGQIENQKDKYNEHDLEYYGTLQGYYGFIGDNNKALEFALKKIEYIKKHELFDLMSEAYYTSISGIGSIYKKLGDYDKWAEYKFLAFDNLKNILHTRSEASLMIDIADIYFTNKRDYEKAEMYYKKGIDIIKNKLSLNIQLYDDSLLQLAMFYREIKSEEAYRVIIKILQKNKNDIEKYTSFLTADEINSIKYLVERGQYMTVHDFNLEKLINHPEINIACYENELLLKNLSLRNQQRIKTSIETNGDTTVKQKYQQLLDNKRYITKLDELPIAERPSDYEQLIADTENLEKELTRLSSTFADAKNSLSVSWKQIQDKLKPNEVAIDLVSYNYYNKKWTGGIMYGAFIIKKDMKFPKYITLFEENQLKQLLAKDKTNIDSLFINQQYQSKAISDLFYKPLEQELKNCKTIFLAPSGLAHQINFKALPILENKTFGEEYDIKLVGSTAALVSYNSASFGDNKNLEFILYGGIDYNKKSIETNNEESQDNFNALATRSGITEFGYLNGTNDEVEKINQEAKKHNYKTTLKTEKSATEESIKQLDGKTTPYVLHLATHGFFFENIKKELPENDMILEEKSKYKLYKSSDDPMLRSGLILAGANKYWGKTNEATETDDGILTAKEISNLDLSACQLVVLSACETGLGQINGSEGVFGLQRAFKMAGVKNIIMSLWKVPDVQTSELFEIFYSECFSGASIPEAFQRAQIKMKSKYEPYYWAGFILLE